MMSNKYLFPILIYFFLVSCSSKTKETSTEESLVEKIELRYAKGFSIEKHKDYTQIVVFNPWNKAQIMDKYILIDREKETPKNLPEGKIVKTPLQKTAISSSIFGGQYKQLSSLKTICAVTEPKYIDIPEIQKNLAEGKIINLGLSTNIDKEKLISSKAEALIVSAYEVSTYENLNSKTLTVIKDASYMEETPLGRSEWIRFEAAFLKRDKTADSICKQIERRYTELVNITSKATTKPSVFTEKRSGDIWYIAGGKSFIANFLKDAGAKYIWSDLNSTGSKPFSVEQVYSKAIDADFWLIKYNHPKIDITINEFGNEYALYKNFKAYKTGNIYAINSGKTPYYEEGPLEPDVVLADLIKIFHPELLKTHSPKYYFKLATK